MLQTFAFYLSFLMALYLFSYAYVEGLRISNAEGKVYGGTFMMTVVSAFIFSAFTYKFL